MSQMSLRANMLVPGSLRVETRSIALDFRCRALARALPNTPKERRACDSVTMYNLTLQHTAGITMPRRAEDPSAGISQMRHARTASRRKGVVSKPWEARHMSGFWRDTLRGPHSSEVSHSSKRNSTTS